MFVFVLSPSQLKLTTENQRTNALVLTPALHELLLGPRLPPRASERVLLDPVTRHRIDKLPVGSAVVGGAVLVLVAEGGLGAGEEATAAARGGGGGLFAVDRCEGKISLVIIVKALF